MGADVARGHTWRAVARPRVFPEHPAYGGVPLLIGDEIQIEPDGPWHVLTDIEVIGFNMDGMPLARPGIRLTVLGHTSVWVVLSEVAGHRRPAQ